MDEKGVHVDPSKIQVIFNWLALKTMTELRSFFGLANFYRRFVLGFSHITRTLRHVTKGGANSRFVWATSQHKAFEDLKSRLCSTPFLIFPDL
jgi:hypothetical protein